MREPSGDIVGSAIQLNLNKSFSVISCFRCALATSARRTTRKEIHTSDARRFMLGSRQELCDRKLYCVLHSLSRRCTTGNGNFSATRRLCRLKNGRTIRRNEKAARQRGSLF